MKPFSELTHYEILEVARDAASEHLERAYRIARSTYAEDSLATYSIYDQAELAAIQERIELAYKVLCNEAERRRYDEELGGSPRLELTLSFADVDEERLDNAPEIRGFDEDGEGDRWDGARLRRARLARGIELDRIAAITKIGGGYLRAIEEDRHQDLPALVYVRGFVSAYARCLGLDAERILPSYMERVQASRPEKPARLPVRRGR